MGFGGSYESEWSFAQATTGGTSKLVEVDMQGWEGCEFIGSAGTTSAIAKTVTVAQAASTTASFVNVTGGSKVSDASATDFSVVDIYKPRKRYLQATVSTTASARLHIAARKYRPRNLQTSSTLVTFVASPDT